MTLLPVVLLAGGLGMRLRPYTETLPKSLVLIAGRPFIDYQLRLLKAQHISDVVLLIGYRGESIEHYVGNGARYGLSVSYHHEGDRLKGTAGCIESIHQSLPEAFFVLYGDSYLLVDFLTVQQDFLLSKKLGLMTICKHNNREQPNNVDMDIHETRIMNYNKLDHNPHFAYLDYGLSVFKKTVFTPNLGKQRDLSDYFQQLIHNNDLGHHITDQPFYEVGSLDGIKQFRTSSIVSNFCSSRF